MLKTPTSPNCELYAPVAGWLSKMTALPFGRSRWVSKYFVLLDSELRYYKDEHCDTPAQILNLREVRQVVPVTTSQHPYAFRLEPTLNKKEQRSNNQRSPSFIHNRNGKPWVLACRSDLDKQHWMSAINRRIIKYSPLASPNTPTDVTPVHKRSKSDAGSVVSCTAFFIVSPDAYRSPTVPLRCTNDSINLSSATDNPSNDSTDTTSIVNNNNIQQIAKLIPNSLLTRRNKKLSPIKIPFQNCSFDERGTLVDMNDRSSEDCASPPSPTGAVLGQSPKRIIPAKRLNDLHSLDNIPSIQMVTFLDQPYVFDTELASAESSSPTYALYKKKFGL